MVLISTYWNVNRDEVEAYAKAMEGFNLNLLECKFHLMREKRCFLNVLISTYWNVNWLVAACAEQAGLF